MSSVIEVNDTTWNEEVNDSVLPVLVCFSADWCGACKRFYPTLEQLAIRFAGRTGFAGRNAKAKVCKLNTDSSRHMTRQQGVRALPTIILYINGHEVARTEGGRSEAWFYDWITSYVEEARGGGLISTETLEPADSEPLQFPEDKS